MRLRCLLVTLAATLCVAAPASAQQGELGIPPDAPVCSGVGDVVTGCSNAGDPPGDAATVGDGQVVTDPASEIEEPPAADDSDGRTAPRRGQLHSLGADDRSAGVAAPQGAPASASDAEPAAVKRTASATATRVAARPRAGRGTLPFTGVDAGPLALFGVMLLAGGLGLRRAARAGA